MIDWDDVLCPPPATLATEISPPVVSQLTESCYMHVISEPRDELRGKSLGGSEDEQSGVRKIPNNEYLVLCFINVRFHLAF